MVWTSGSTLLDYDGSLPPVGSTVTYSFTDIAKMLVSLDGGVTFTRVQAPSAATMQITGTIDSDNTRYFDTEMLQLDISGGSLPPGIMIRESPTRASTGRTSVRTDLGGGYMIDSFFDIFTEVSTDGGQTWRPTLLGPATILSGHESCNTCSNLNKKGLIDLMDFAIMANNWQWVETPGDAVNMADNDCDGAVDMHDLAIFVDNWLQTCP